MSLLSSLLAIPFIFSAISSLLASPISKRFGLLPTMALTHLPSAVLLGLLPLAPTIVWACALLVLRAALSTMDQGPRAVFLAQVVKPEERTKVMGVVNTVKTMAQSGGPTVTGWMAQGGHFGVVFVLGGALKAIYDLALMGLWLSGRARKEPNDFALQAADESGENDGQIDPSSTDMNDREGKRQRRSDT
jgi:MFS family permease